MESIMRTIEPITAEEFFGLEVDEKLKVELIGGALVAHAADPLTAEEFFSLGARGTLKVGVPRPDVLVVRSGRPGSSGVAEGADVVLAGEIVSSSSRLYDRLVKPSLYRDAGIPSWRIERDRSRLALFEIPLRGDEVAHVGPVTLKVADIDVPIDLDAIAVYALGE